MFRQFRLGFRALLTGSVKSALYEWSWAKPMVALANRRERRRAGITRQDIRQARRGN